ncbi:MAG TPA: Rieske (2Fe-2S) protein [Isosphaeraceae bacterium]|jgi:menaquinol-cytochrome c reductase iron-sulfur subunit|nr:Rieske (2Fe-2S) protein [Isosphaeraceae bacterium]
MTHRRDLYRYLTLGLGGLMSLVLAVPGMAYLLDPLDTKRRRQRTTDFVTLARLSELTPNVARAFPIIEDRQDAWVKYPREPVGSVWLIRQAEGSKTPVIAFTAECPHLGCSVGLAPEGRSFLCPCHTSAFAFDGERKNEVPPRPMDRLEVKLSSDSDPDVQVKFQRFRTMEKEMIPLA